MSEVLNMEEHGVTTKPPRTFVVQAQGNGSDAIRIYQAKTPSEAAATAFSEKEFAGVLEVRVVNASKGMAFRRANKAVRVKG